MFGTTYEPSAANGRNQKIAAKNTKKHEEYYITAEVAESAERVGEVFAKPQAVGVELFV